MTANSSRTVDCLLQWLSTWLTINVVRWSCNSTRVRATLITLVCNNNNIGTFKHRPAQVDNLCRTDIENFPEATENGIVEVDVNYYN